MMRESRKTFLVMMVLPLAWVVSASLGEQAAAPPFWTYADFLGKKTPQSYTLRKGHPRLLITPDNKAEIIEKIKAAPKLWQRVIREAEKGGSYEAILACGAIYQLGLVEGFKYSMTGAEYGRKGVTKLMSPGSIRRKDALPMCMLELPCGYDWLYDLLSDQQKAELAKRMVEAAPKLVSTFNGPGGRGMLMGLAFHGDGVDDAAARDIVERFWKLWWDPGAMAGKTAMRNVIQLILYNEGGGNTEGSGYLTRCFPIWPTMAVWKTATGQDYLAKMGYYRNLPYWLTNCVAPVSGAEKGAYMLIAHHGYQSGGLYARRTINAIMGAATGYLSKVDPPGAALARWWVDHNRGYDSLDLVFGLLIGDPRVKGRSPAELKLPGTFVMPGPNKVYLRSGWADPDATAIAFGNDRFGTVRSATPNGISLWKNKGALFVYRGHIARHGYYGKSGAVPFNHLAFFGTPRIGISRETRLMAADKVRGSRYDYGSETLQTRGAAGEYDYIRGDASRKYSKPVKLARRTLVYFRPLPGGKTDYLILLDRVDTGVATARPHVVFNTPLEPRIGPAWGRQAEGETVFASHIAYDDAPCVTVTNDHLYDYGAGRKKQAHARAFVKVLHPARVRVLKIGGPEHFMDGMDGKGSRTPDLFQSWNRLGRNSRIIKGGFWRFHVVPTAQAARHAVLTAMELTDSKVARPGALELLQSATLLAAQAGPNVVAFSKDGARLSGGSFKTAAPAGRILICDLEPGAEYTLTAGGKSAKLKATSAGTIFAKDVKLTPGDEITIRESRP